MKLTDMLKELNIGKWSACWAFITDGWAGLGKLVCEAFTKILRKAEPEKLKGHAEFTQKVAVFVTGGVETFCTDEKTMAAGKATAEAIGTLAEHISDGEYTKDELAQDVANIEKCITAWKEV